MPIGVVQGNALARNTPATELAAGPLQVFSGSNTNGEQCLPHSSEGMKRRRVLPTGDYIADHSNSNRASVTAGKAPASGTLEVFFGIENCER